MENTTSTTEKPRRTRTMSEAALAANRENAKKSTGPRTAAGKARSASNNYRHGLYQFSYYDAFNNSHDLNLATAHNFLEQLAPLTPIEHTYAHAIITLQLRHLQLEVIYGEAVSSIAGGQVPKYFHVVMRELHQIPNRLEKLLKAYRAEVALRDGKEVEKIQDLPPLPNPRLEEEENSETNPNPPINSTSHYINQFLYILSLSKTDDPVHLEALRKTVRNEAKMIRKREEEANKEQRKDPVCGNLHEEL